MVVGQTKSLGKLWAGTSKDRPVDGSLTRDQIFEVLSNERRRLILFYLNQQDEGKQVSFRELVDQVAAWENGTTVDELRSSERKCVYSALRQSHLPKLQKLGVIEFDHLRGEVILTDAAEDIEVYLEYVPGNDITWSQVYVGLSAIAATLVALHWAAVGPFGALDGIVLAGFIVTTFVTASVVHLVRTRQHRLDAAYQLVDGETA